MIRYFSTNELRWKTLLKQETTERLEYLSNFAVNPMLRRLAGYTLEARKENRDQASAVGIGYK